MTKLVPRLCWLTYNIYEDILGLVTLYKLQKHAYVGWKWNGLRQPHFILKNIGLMTKALSINKNSFPSFFSLLLESIKWTKLQHYITQHISHYRKSNEYFRNGFEVNRLLPNLLLLFSSSSHQNEQLKMELIYSQNTKHNESFGDTQCFCIDHYNIYSQFYSIQTYNDISMSLGG